MVSKQFIDGNGGVAPVMKPGNTQVVDGTSASAQTSVYSTRNVIYLCSTGAFNLAVGTNPTASNSTMYIPAGLPTYIRVDQGNKIAVFGASVNITTME